jgi:hypothetical protein
VPRTADAQKQDIDLSLFFSDQLNAPEFVFNDRSQFAEEAAALSHENLTTEIGRPSKQESAESQYRQYD